jgi:protein-S-isoprenylcysteine O-methyltransferase Ste14
MNWYYQFRIGLDMVYFWTKMLPTIMVSATVLLICKAISHAVFIPGFAGFIINGTVYCIIFFVAAWFLIATKGERRSLKAKILHK